MTICFLGFYLDNISLVLLADKLYTGVNEGIKKLLLYSLFNHLNPRDFFYALRAVILTKLGTLSLILLGVWC